ncbi:MAG: hypothetical protein AVDCRST_MAG16-3083 [uncultured Frankineae bacterium]|uniref:Uncharacterized protein n=1 Tax=uncultured Frankineae bacterium TaxID=437475 RepID=A0A6J4MLX1_9ACTN|nr:MAG: hypothetical protein AVDCRST_MAG16-3083 [uncultured Frankineae bacterium]
MAVTLRRDGPAPTTSRALPGQPCANAATVLVAARHGVVPSSHDDVADRSAAARAA